MASTDIKKPKRNIDMYQLNKCTLCSYSSHVKSTFQRHLIKMHGIKLKGLEEEIPGQYATLGRVVNDYGLGQKFAPQLVFEHRCLMCKKKFNSHHSLKFHQKSCNKNFKVLKDNAPVFTCRHCGSFFLKQRSLNQHNETCGKMKDICCQICPFKCLNMFKIQWHTIDKHNLICKPVDEPDFEQALNGTPYTLERVVELEKLPEAPQATAGNKRKKLVACLQCNREFPKERSLATSMEIHEKLQEYEHFVEDKLKSDLRDIELILTRKSSSCKEWSELKNVVTAITEFKEKERDMNVHFNLGNDVSSFAKICDYESAYVDIGLGYILEMNREEANKYADIRIKLLQKEINHLRKLAVNVKVHIKMVLLAIAELQATAKFK